jgi:hypothetical protein
MKYFIIILTVFLYIQLLLECKPKIETICDQKLPAEISMILVKSIEPSHQVYRKAEEETNEWREWDTWMDTVEMISDWVYIDSTYYILGISWSDSILSRMVWFNGEKFTSSYFDAYKTTDTCALKTLYFIKREKYETDTGL